MAAIQGWVPGRAAFPPNIRPLATANLFLCFTPHTGFPARLEELGFLMLGRALNGIIRREAAEEKKKKGR